jgi:hypothetical protein
VANTLNLFRDGAVGFIEWLDVVARTDTTQLNTDGLARRDIYVARLALESSDEYINARSHCDNEVAISVGSSFGYERWVPRRPLISGNVVPCFDAGMSCAMAVHIDDVPANCPCAAEVVAGQQGEDNEGGNLHLTSKLSRAAKRHRLERFVRLLYMTRHSYILV